MALLTWEAKVEGVQAAEDAIAALDDQFQGLADTAAGADAALGGVAPAAEAAAKGAKKTGEGMNAARSATAGLEAAVGSLNKAAGLFGAVGLLGAVQGLVDLATKFYEATDAGKAAQAATEAHNAALQATIDLLTGVSDASRVATADLVAYYRVRKSAEGIEIELNALLDERLKLDGQLRNARLGGDVNAQRKYSEAIRDTDARLSRLKDRLGEVTAEQKALTAAVEDAGAAMTGNPLALLLEGVEKASDKVRTEAARIQREADAAAKALRESLTRALDLSGAIDLDSLPPLTLDVAIAPLDADALTRELLGPLEGGAEDMAARLADAYVASGQKVRDEMAAMAADAQRAADAIFNAWSDGPTAALEQFGAGLADSIDNALTVDGPAAWAEWSRAAQGAIDQISGMLGSFRVAFDAVTSSTLTARANDVVAAEDALRMAERAERIAQGNLAADRESVALKGEAQRASEARLAAEEAVYKAQLKQWKAERDAAEAQKVFKALEFALEGTKAAAKSIESFALASFLAALPFGAGAPFVPAAIAAGVTYAAAAAAYGVGAVATATAETPTSARPTPPDDRSETVAAGDRNRGGDGGMVVNLNFAGQPLETRADIQNAAVEAIDAASRRRGRPRANLAAIQSRGRRR